MLLWKNTKTLEGLIDDIPQTELKNDAIIALIGSKPITLEEFPNLKGIFRAGVSTTNMPIKEAKDKNISICFPSEKTKNYIYEETANFTCGLIFKSHYKNLGTLEPWEKYKRNAFSGKTLLIIGEGKIGSMVKEKMSSFLKILVFDPLKYQKFELDQLLPNADIITIHIPDINENKNFIGSEKMSLMKDNAVLINTARGSVVDENSLYEELRNERLFAVFDVYWQEPYEGKLKEFFPDRFMMTPHIASTCNEFLTGSEVDLRNFIKYLENRT